MVRKTLICSLVFLWACGPDTTAEVLVTEEPGPQAEELVETNQAVTCSPRMSVFPVAAPHNIGWDKASCGSGTCKTSCPDQHANSDWSTSGHQGIDVFAYHRAPLVAVAPGTIVKVGWVSSTSGIRVRLRDDCGWEYYYGHLDEAKVKPGQRVVAGQVIGFMGNTGTQGVHLHFNVSPDGNYSNDINPFNLLWWTSNTDCNNGFYPLHRHFSPFDSDHYYSTNPITNGFYGLVYEGTEGRMARTQQPGTVPLRQLFHTVEGHLYSTNPTEISQAKAKGYKDDGVIGYVYPASSTSGKVPIYGYHNAFSKDWFYTKTPMPDGAYGFVAKGVRWKSP